MTILSEGATEVDFPLHFIESQNHRVVELSSWVAASIYLSPGLFMRCVAEDGSHVTDHRKTTVFNSYASNSRTALWEFDGSSWDGHRNGPLWNL